MRLRTLFALPLVPAVISCSHAVRSAETVYASQSCPLPGGARGYPVTVRAEGVSVSEQYLTQVALAVGGTWRGVRAEQELSVVANDIPPTWRFPGSTLLSRAGWDFEPDQRETLRMVLRRNGSVRMPEAVEESGNSGFRRAARFATFNAMQSGVMLDRARDTMPKELPRGFVGDSLILVIAWGQEPRAGEGVARFAVQEKAAEGIGNRTARPRTRMYEPITTSASSLLVTFVVDTLGRMDLDSFHAVSEADEPLLTRLRATLVQVGPQVAYRPAELNCRRVAHVRDSDARNWNGMR
ncbi:MAG: hypothetical protein JWO05_1473 [Gemmatimonadetes bacterium]|nr:hypothetical protein [Gemmatimonadota bacterium]